MRIIKDISTDEVILTFLKAEFNSSRFRVGSMKALQILQLDKKLIDTPNLSSKTENEQRSKILHLTRGWPNEWLFTNFPTNVHWQLVNLSQHEISESYRLNSGRWPSKQSRKVQTVLDQINSGIRFGEIDSTIVFAITSIINSGHELLPVILVSKDTQSEKVIVEGHTRCLAYAAASPQNLSNGVEVILGTSKSIAAWKYY